MVTEFVKLEDLLCHVDTCAHVAYVIHLLLLVPNALRVDAVALIARPLVQVVTRHEEKLDVLEVVVLTDAPDLEHIT